jgi:hypothetical protein
MLIVILLGLLGVTVYAKLFTSIYQGTLRGNSHGLLVFTNLLAHCDKAGVADIHPRAIAEEVGLTVEQVRAALDVLESPDDESRSPEEQGRRIVRIDEHRAWGWRVVNYVKYRSIRNEEDRREQNRESQERYRNRHKPPSAAVSRRKPQSAHTEAEAEVEAKKHIDAPSASPKALVSVSDLIAIGVDKQSAADWLRARREKKLPLTRTAMESVQREATKAGLTVPEAVRRAASEGWAGFKASWLDGDRGAMAAAADPFAGAV